MNRLTRSALALAVGFVGATAVFQAVGPDKYDNDDPIVLGQVDVFDYCSDVFGDNASALLVGGNAYSWRCSSRPNGIFLLTEVDFSDACTRTYGNARSRNWDESDPYAWECVEP